MSTPAIQVTVNGALIETSGRRSILKAFIDSGQPLIADVGCLGQGVCGSYRVLIRRAGEREVSTAWPARHGSSRACRSASSTTCR